MDIAASMQQLDALEKKMIAFMYAQSVVYYDGMTVAPKQSVQDRGNCLALLAEEQYKLFYNEEIGGLLAGLFEIRDQLDAPARRRVEILKEDYDKNFRIPMDEYVEYSVLLNESDHVWQTAKNTNDFASFAPYLEKIFATLKKFAGYMAPGVEPYEVWLGEHEKGLTRAACDAYFEQIKAGLVPLIQRINAAKQLDNHCVEGHFPIEKQRELSSFLMDTLTIPRDRCILGEVEHPFCSGMSIDDVRITTHYYENNLLSSMFSVIHEGGHALYNLGSNPDFRNTMIAYPASTSIHESQSRFFENIIARSREFTAFLLPELQRLFPEQLGNLTAEQFFLAANRAEPSLIRIEADELTYSMHILIRYEIEKMIFDGKIEIADLPATWNRLYKEYLGIDVPDDSRGVLQDTHWGSGLVGYFPSYSLGSAYAAQMLASMRKDIDVFGCAASGDLAPIVAWLRERVHRDGGMPIAQEVIEKSCGAPFSPQYYIDYLTEKYSAIYNQRT